ncbi:MAG: hypothetical protein WC533_02260 [Candidatus Pacearchaeota archaeon]
MKKVNKFIFWTPRIISIIFVVFLAVMSLDVFGNDYTFWQTVLALFMHNIPVIVLALLLWASWRREWVGAITFIGTGILYIAFVLTTAVKNGFEWYYLSWAIQISGIAFFIGILFFIGWRKKKK